MGDRKYTLKDAARETGASTNNAAAAHHQARDDSGVRYGGDTEALKVNAIEQDLASPDGIMDWLFGSE